MQNRQENLPVSVVFDSASATCFTLNGSLSLLSFVSSSPSAGSDLTSASWGDFDTPSNVSFLVMGADMEVRLLLMTAFASSPSQSPSNTSRGLSSTFSLLHLLTLWRMNFVISCNGKFVWQSPQTSRSFSCSTEIKEWKKIRQEHIQSINFVISSLHQCYKVSNKRQFK